MDARQLFRTVVSAALLLALLPPVFAAQGKAPDLGQLQKTLAERLPKSKIVDIKPAAVPGLYEVFTSKTAAGGSGR